MRANLIGPEHMKTKFFWDYTTKIASADISDFGRYATVWGRLYADACDEGFVVNWGGGKKTPFYLDREEIRDGEIVAWHFRTVLETQLGGVGWKIVLFND